MQNFNLLAWKMSELWLFKILTSEAEVEVDVEVEAEAEARYVTGGFHMKVLAKTPGLYQVPKLRNSCGKNVDQQTYGQSDFYYPLGRTAYLSL